MYLLPQVSAEDLNEGNLECRDFTVHENSGEVELHLEADVDVSAVNRWRPPECEATVGDLHETGALGVGQFLEEEKKEKREKKSEIETLRERQRDTKNEK